MKTIKELLRAKRDGHNWTAAEVEFFVNSVVTGAASNAQAAAFLMAACTRGLNTMEIAALTSSMAASGAQLGRGLSSRKAIDKHSTGGVGDKISLVLTPIAVECGLAVPMISGRGLGHTGGTTDKLESVQGFQTILPMDQMQQLLVEHHTFMVGQSDLIAPADKILYRLRDVTGTVENVGLIASSILSKKLTEGLDGLVMDMKVGSAAFMQSFDDSRQLAEEMLRICKACSLPITFVFTRMDTVIGNSVGNWVEMVEAEQTLAGNGWEDVNEITKQLAIEMVLLGGEVANEDLAEKKVSDVISSGRGVTTFHDILKRQGGDWDASAKKFERVFSKDIVGLAGAVPHVDARELSLAVLRAGGGRQIETDVIDPFAGIVFHKKPFDVLEHDGVVATVYASLPEKCLALQREVEQLLQTTMAPVVEEPSRIIDIWRWG